MSMSVYKISQKVEFPIPSFPEFAIGEIIKVENKVKRRKRVGYRVRVEKPVKLRNKIVYIPEGVIRRRVL